MFGRDETPTSDILIGKRGVVVTLYYTRKST
jgi:hypothetical protein